MKLTDFLNSINYKKDDLFSEDIEYAEKMYQSFVVNRSLSYFPDTIFHANEMNILNRLDSKLQYDYLKHSVRKRKRFSKWLKNDKLENIDLIKEYFNYSNNKAQEALKILSNEDFSSIRGNMYTGGTK